MPNEYDMPSLPFLRNQPVDESLSQVPRIAPEFETTSSEKKMTPKEMKRTRADRFRMVLQSLGEMDNPVGRGIRQTLTLADLKERKEDGV